MDENKEASFIRMLLAGEPRIKSYLISLLPSTQDVEDVMQESCIVMWEKYGDFLETQDGKPELARFIAWGNQIAFYKALNLRRRKHRSVMLLSNDAMKLIADEWSRQERAKELIDMRSTLAHCIERLPKHRSDLLLEYYWKHTDVEQLASRLRRTTNSVYKMLQRTRKALFDCIELNAVS